MITEAHRQESENYSEFLTITSDAKNNIRQMIADKWAEIDEALSDITMLQERLSEIEVERLRVKRRHLIQI